MMLFHRGKEIARQSGEMGAPDIVLLARSKQIKVGLFSQSGG